MPTAKVTKNVSAATGGGNVLCSTLISIKTKAWLYSFRQHFDNLALPCGIGKQECLNLIQRFISVFLRMTPSPEHGRSAIRISAFS